MESYRRQIDFIDNKILFYLRERIILSEKICKLKKEMNHTIYNENREKEIINKLIIENNKIQENTNPFKNRR
tara:strand:- start:3728 stop:3943 length:216 start_codon:yes stop_codon:yes gene_type:complete